MTPDQTPTDDPAIPDEDYEVKVVKTDAVIRDETDNVKEEGDPFGDNFA